MSEFHVDPVVGHDANSGSAQAPFRTIAHAVGELGDGDVLFLSTRAPFPPAVFPAALAGSEDAPIRIESAGPGPAAFDGALPALARAGNDAWEPVPGGHPDEWRTKEILVAPSKRALYRYGRFADSGYRLLTYSRIGDLRAANESFHRVALADRRPAGGPLENDLTRKVPWVYLGPGVVFVFEDPGAESGPGRIHVRLSATHIEAPGIEDYRGVTDPNEVALWIAREDVESVRIGARHVVFRNLTFRNGGEATISIGGGNLRFDHCRIDAARFGARIEADAGPLRFEHCTFDGGLAPWTMRADVKSSYTYLSAFFGPGDPRNEPKGNTLANKTSDRLVFNQADDVTFDHCTFRHGHDGIQVKARDVDIHHCLFEDLNDEAVQFDTTAEPGIAVHENLFRQVLHAFSFALNLAGGPVLIYRNVVDQRVPTRGFRVLPPDAPAPFIWRHGASFKMGDPVPAFHCYQNTFLGSHPEDQAHVLSPVFANPPPAPAPARTYLNNLHVGLELDMPHSHVVPNDPTRIANGNLWHQPGRRDAPLFLLPDGTKLFTLEQLAAIDPEWERDGTFAAPGCASLTDESFEHQVPYPSADLRVVAGAPGSASGVVLPADLPDPLRPEGGARPDVGAMGPEPIAAGVDGAALLPRPGVPEARAGDDRTVLDEDDDGFAVVTVDGSASADPGGSPLRFRWRLGERTVASSAVAALELPEGEHILRLLVENEAGETGSDMLRISVRPSRHHGENLLRSPGFEDGATGWTIAEAAFAQPPDTRSGLHAIRLDAIAQQPVVAQEVPISPGVTYRVSAWIRRVTEAPTTTIRCVFRDAAGRELAVADMVHDTPGTGYVYREATAISPAGAATMALLVGHELTGTVLFDDVRVLDGNLLANPGFERHAPSGDEEKSPGWTFERPGSVTDDPVLVRGGSRALALPGGRPEFQQVIQTVPVVAGRRYRIAGWVRRGATFPELRFRFPAQQGSVPLDGTPEGTYAFVDRAVTAPAGADTLTVRLRLPANATGTSCFDDLSVIELPPAL
jgi:hypothetical protein